MNCEKLIVKLDWLIYRDGIYIREWFEYGYNCEYEYEYEYDLRYAGYAVFGMRYAVCGMLPQPAFSEKAVEYAYEPS